MSYLQNALVLGGSFMVLVACGAFNSGSIKEKLTGNKRMAPIN